MKQDLENYGFVDKAAFKNETQDLVDPRAWGFITHWQAQTRDDIPWGYLDKPPFSMQINLINGRHFDDIICIIIFLIKIWTIHYLQLTE